MAGETAGETDLAKLLQTMQPTRQPGEFVFCTVEASYSNPELQPLGWFRELEGLTLILSRQQAEAAGLPYEGAFCQITLAVHSSLEAVGFLAAITNRLAAQGISVNPVSAYYHDHLFVPLERADQTMAILHTMTG